MSASFCLKTPITYYGGKRRMLRHILPRIPAHVLYTEPFCGGAAVFFAKAPSLVEVLTDTNGEVMNFYAVLQRQFSALHRAINTTLHSRQAHTDARVMYLNPHYFPRSSEPGHFGY